MFALKNLVFGLRPISNVCAFGQLSCGNLQRHHWVNFPHGVTHSRKRKHRKFLLAGSAARCEEKMIRNGESKTDTVRAREMLGNHP